MTCSRADQEPRSVSLSQAHTGSFCKRWLVPHCSAFFVPPPCPLTISLFILPPPLPSLGSWVAGWGWHRQRRGRLLGRMPQPLARPGRAHLLLGEMKSQSAPCLPLSQEPRGARPWGRHRGRRVGWPHSYAISFQPNPQFLVPSWGH